MEKKTCESCLKRPDLFDSVAVVIYPRRRRRVFSFITGLRDGGADDW